MSVSEIRQAIRAIKWLDEQALQDLLTTIVSLMADNQFTNTDKQESIRDQLDDVIGQLDDILDSDPRTCSACSGSGEGMFEGTKCHSCNGTGISNA